MRDDRDLDEFATRLARPLRAPESLDATFEARVMSAVLAEGRNQRPATLVRPGAAAAPRDWWRRSRTIRLSPLGGLGIAAGIGAVAMLGALAGRSLAAPADADRIAAVAPVVPETVHVVRFVFADPAAKSVSLVGDFNGWSKGATPLVAEAADGVWSVSVAVPAGRHEYAFVVQRADGERWTADPHASRVRDEFGVESSLVTVGRVRPVTAPPSQT